MAKSLKMVFSLGESKTATYTLADPKDGLSKSEVETAMNEMVQKNAILVGGVSPTGVKEFYIQSSERTELA